MKEDDSDKNHLTPVEDKTSVIPLEQNGTTALVPDGRVTPTPSKAGEEDDLPIKTRFRLYTKESWDAQCKKERDTQRKIEKNDGKAVAHLVDGELKFEDDEEEAKKDRDPALVEQNELPEELSVIFRADYAGKPLEEIDKYIKDKTFIAIAPRFKRNYIHRFTATKSLFLLTPWSPIRKLAVYIATNQFFDYLVILTILCNCIFLAMPGSSAAETAEYVFLGVYTIECTVKITARGLILYRFTYLRDPWNWLDFIVIISAYTTILIEAFSSGGSVGNLQGLRTFRVLRALKTVSIVPGLKTLVGALLRAFKLLLEVILLITFCLMIFAMFGLQMYMGVLRQKCVLEVPSYTATPSLSYEQYYYTWVKNTSNWYESDGDYLICGNASGSGACPEGYTCLQDIGENPNFGYTSFDHFGWAMLTSFQLITLDFWEDCYNKIIRASGPWNVLFFVVVVFFGSFYLINLMLAVVAMSYEEEAVNTDKENEEKEKKEQEKDPVREIENAKKAATKWKSKKEKSDLSQVNGINGTVNTDNKDQKDKVGNDSSSGTVTINGNTLVKHGKGRNPMVKMPSKDSGYSVQSQSSSQSGGSKDTPRDDVDNISLDSYSNPKKADSGTGSMSHGLNDTTPVDKRITKLQKPFLKQESSGNVSSSGIHLERGSQEHLECDSVRSEANEKDKKEKGPKVIIIKGDDNTGINKPGTLVDRNCECCSRTSLFTTWLWVQNKVFIVAMDPLFDLFITICIVLNTVFMSLEHYGMSQELSDTLKYANYIFTSVFTLEAVLKLISLSKLYFNNGWNIFDLLIVIASLVDLGLEDVDGLSVFRTFRLLRVFKLAQSWPTMRLLLTIILSTLGALGYLTIILIIIIYIFAVIGLQLFNESYTEDKFAPDDVPRWNFKDFYHAMLMVFRILCGEWIEPLWDCMRAADELCMVVFLPTLVLGNFIVLNLFLALLLNAFASDSLDKQADPEENRLMLAVERIKNICCCCFKFKTARTASVGPDDIDEEKAIGIEDEKESKDKKPEINGKKPKEENGKSSKPQANGTTVSSDKAGNSKDKNKDQKDKDNKDKKDKDNKDKDKKDKDKDKKDKDNQDNVSDDKEQKDDDVDKAFDVKRDKFSSFDAARKASKSKDGDDKASGSKDKENNNDKKSDDDEDKEKGKPKDDDTDSLEEAKVLVVHDCFPAFMIKPEKWEKFDESSLGKKWYSFRKFMVKVVENKIFEYFILVLIGLSSMALAFEDVYLYEKPELETALYYLNITFVVIFTIEMILKMLALGFKVYFTSFWTILDFCIVVISWASFAAEAAGAADISAFRSLRTLRAFRPLRAISRWQSMRIVVNALMLAIPAIMNVVVVCLVFWLIFSIMGVQFFSGKFYSCKDADGERLLPTVVANKSQCLALADSMNYTWSKPNINFDHVGSGYLALFQVATFEGWMEVIGDATDTTDIDEQPRFEASTAYYMYFVAFIIFGAFFTLNLIIGVIIDNFNVLKKKYEGSYLDMFLTQSQRNYMNTLKKLGNKKPQKTIRRPKNSCLAVFYDVSVSTKFDMFIVMIIFFNMISMAVEHYNQTQMTQDILDILNIIFTTVFTMEAIVKIIGLGYHYFRQPWNVFDFVVVVLSLLGIILADILANIFVTPTLLRVVRVFRIGRVLRLIKAAKGIRKLLFALIISMPALINIGALLCLIMYIYAIIGMSSFGNLKITDPLDDTVNFKTFANSFVLLLRLATSAGWNDILEPLLLSPPDCDPDYATRPDGTLFKTTNGDCGTPWLAIFYMCSYILIIFLIIINMYIAVILENFNQAHEAEEVGITEDDFDEFYVVWEKYDPLATQFIKYEHLSHFVGDLDPPLGIPRPNEIALVAFDLPIVEGDKIHCLDVLISLCKNVLGKVDETEEFKELYSQIENKFQDAFPTRVNTNKTSSTMQKKKEDVAAKTLQRAWRSYKTQKQLRNITKMALQKAEADENEKNAKKKGTSLFSLGRRLSSALTNFFSSSRPTSAMSRVSVKSATGPDATGNNKKKVQSTLQVPAVGALYPKGSDGNDVEL